MYPQRYNFEIFDVNLVLAVSMPTQIIKNQLKINITNLEKYYDPALCPVTFLRSALVLGTHAQTSK